MLFRSKPPVRRTLKKESEEKANAAKAKADEARNASKALADKTDKEKAAVEEKKMKDSIVTGSNYRRKQLRSE